MGSLAAALIALIVLSMPFGAPQGGVIRAAGSDLVLGDMTFPQNIGRFTRGGSRNFESDDPGLGFSVAYYLPDVTATIFVYDKRLMNIPDGHRSALIREELDSALEEIAGLVQQGYYESWKLKEKGEFRNSSSGFGYRFAALTLGRDGRVLNSYLFITGLAGKFIKARITAAAGAFSADDARDFAMALVEALGRQPGNKRAWRGLPSSPLNGLPPPAAKPTVHWRRFDTIPPLRA